MWPGAPIPQLCVALVCQEGLQKRLGGAVGCVRRYWHRQRATLTQECTMDALHVVSLARTVTLTCSAQSRISRSATVTFMWRARWPPGP